MRCGTVARVVGIGVYFMEIEKVYRNLSRDGKAEVIRFMAVDIIEQAFQKENFAPPRMKDYIFDGLGDWAADVTKGEIMCNL